MNSAFETMRYVYFNSPENRSPALFPLQASFNQNSYEFNQRLINVQSTFNQTGPPSLPHHWRTPPPCFNISPCEGRTALNTPRQIPSALPRRLRLMGVVSGKCLVWLVSGFFLGALGGAIAGAALGAVLGLIIGGSVEVPRSAAAVGVIGLLSGALTGLLIVPLRLLGIETRYLVAGAAILTRSGRRRLPRRLRRRRHIRRRRRNNRHPLHSSPPLRPRHPPHYPRHRGRNLAYYVQHNDPECPPRKAVNLCQPHSST